MISHWLDLIKRHLDNDYFVCGIFIDLRKTFDTINDDILLVKLVHYGIHGLANSWLSSSLKNRTQYVSLDGHCSITKQVTCVIPEGSTLGLLLFLVYIINDLHGAFSNSRIYNFSRKTNHLFTSIESVVNHKLKLLSQWLQSNKL